MSGQDGAELRRLAASQPVSSLGSAGPVPTGEPSLEDLGRSRAEQLDVAVAVEQDHPFARLLDDLLEIRDHALEPGERLRVPIRLGKRRADEIEQRPVSGGEAARAPVERDADEHTRLGQYEADLVLGADVPVEVAIDARGVELVRVEEVRDRVRATVGGLSVVRDHGMIADVGDPRLGHLGGDLHLGSEHRLDPPLVEVDLVPGDERRRHDRRQHLDGVAA